MIRSLKIQTGAIPCLHPEAHAARSPLVSAAAREEMATPLAHLESHIVNGIFWMAGELLMPYEDTEECQITRESLRVIALVCKEWHAYADNVCSELHLRRCVASSDLIMPTRELFLNLRRCITLSRGYLRHLTLNLTLPNMNLYGHWRSVLCLVPRLKAINLMGIPRMKAQLLASIVRATRSCCPDLHSLLVPSLPVPIVGMHTSKEKLEDAKLLMDAVFDPVVARGSRYKSKLRVLAFSLPFTTQWPMDAFAPRFINRLCDEHPDIELLEGWSRRYKPRDIPNSDLLYIDDVTWERFCATCCSLKSFDWLMAPYTTSCFETFGRYPKPKLISLVLSSSTAWEWVEYYNCIGQAVPSSGYGRTATNIHSALRACPNVEELSVALEVQVRQNLNDFRLPTMPAMDQEIFGDAFCQEVARSCRHLTAFTIISNSAKESMCGTIMSLTDVGLAALATLPNLRSVQLKPVNVSGAGLFNLAVHFATNPEKTRRQLTAQILLGDELGTPCDMRFYKVVVDFLGLLISARGRRPVCVGKCVVLRLINTFNEFLRPETSGEYAAMVKKLAQQATILHPNIRLMLLVKEYDYGRSIFDYATEFIFFTPDADLSRWPWGSKAKAKPAHEFIVDSARLADFA